ncbi:hypothetical protein AAKU67_000752 [Oxalobacteraceae bacterium GrIS 2.11]
MTKEIRSLFIRFLIALMLCACGASAGAQTGEPSEYKDGAWISYRDAYRKMISFEKYGGPKQFLQNHIRVAITDKKSSLDGVRLALEGKKTHLNLPIDAAGRAVLPMQKTAYDDNAELRVNRADTVVKFEYRISIITRSDGIYEIADLRTACDQALHYLRYQDVIRYSLKQCAGVKFSYPKDQNDVSLKVKTGDRPAQSLSINEGSVFADDEYNAFKVALFNFSGNADKGQIVSNYVPLAITALFELITIN